MQEHHTRASSRHQASQRVGRKQHTTGQCQHAHFEIHLGIVAPPFTKGIHSEARCNIMKR
jgi:hypothetical protein